ncbi:hypothetical protein PMAYCL1PPCAC_14269, partial [Pristionchus mayeri]
KLLLEEWKRKICEYSNHSADPLVSVISKGLDLMHLIIKNFEHCVILRALGSLEKERCYNLEFERKE